MPLQQREIVMRLSIFLLILCAQCTNGFGPFGPKITGKPFCVNGDCKEGFGTQQMNSIEIYTGNFRKGLYHGQGELRCGSEAIIKANFLAGDIEGDFELDLKTMIVSGRVEARSYQGVVTMRSSDTKTPYVIKKTYEKGLLHGKTSVVLDSGKASLEFQFQKGSLISAGYYENNIEKMPIKYEKKLEGGREKCIFSAVERGKRVTQEMACVDTPFPEIFRGCNGI